MSHWWNDFNLASPSLGPPLPLTSGQRVMPTSGILPSGEAGFFDNEQDRSLNPTIGLGVDNSEKVGSGINYPFPYPNTETLDKFKYPSGDFYSEFYASGFLEQFSSGWWEESGIFKTYGPTPHRGELVDDQWPKSGSGIAHPYGLQSPFSNAPRSKENSINDFTVFNPYIHHEKVPSTFSTENSNSLQIPYLSTYKVSIDWDAYGQISANVYNTNPYRN